MKRRVAIGASQSELALVAGITPSAINHLENGRRRFPRFDTIQAIEKALMQLEREHKEQARNAQAVA